MPGQRTTGDVGETRNQGVFANGCVDDLKGKSLRGGAITVTAQGIKFVLQTGSVFVLARLLSPADFGIQSMVVAMTGFLGLFRDAGLTVATVQKDVITHEQTSTLFWINTTIGLFLAVLASLLAPLLVSFYREPRLLWVTVVAGSAFIFNGVAAQHQALLVRRLRFMTLASIELTSMMCAVAVGITMALWGFGYWALIGMAVTGPALSAAALWVSVPWIPGRPRRGCGIRSMLHLGGTATANMLVIYLGYNAEKFLLGRFWGAAALGLYSRAYQLANMPMQQLSSSVFNVVFPALSRIQGDVERSCRFFLKGYSLIFSMCVPVTLSCAIFAEDVIPTVLGAQWEESIPVLRLLSPTILAFALVNPLGWFLLSTGRAMRSLRISFLVTPVVILGILAGINYGPKGVATGYSTAMVLLIAPVIAWALKDTGVKALDLLKSLKGPFVSGAVAALVAIPFSELLDERLDLIPRLVLNLFVLNATYAAMLLFGMGQRDFYLDLARRVFNRR